MKTKIYLLIVGAVAGFALLILYALTALSTREIAHAVHSDVQTTQGVLSSFMAERSRALRDQCLLLVSQLGTRHLPEADWKTVTITAKEYVKEMEADRISLTDRNGQVIGDTGLRAPVAINRSHNAGVATALTGGVWSGVVVQDGKLMLVVSAPVRDPVSKGVVATLSAYSAIDASVAANLKRELGYDIAFVQDGQVLAASLPLQKHIATPERTARLIHLGGKDYYALFAPLPDTSASSRIGFVILHSYQFATTTYVQLRLALVVVCLLAVLGAIAIARTLISPISGLVDVARRLSQGEWPDPFTVQRQDEIGVLQTTFNQMIHALKANEEHLLNLIDLDQLTGLPNHRALVTALDQELERSRRFERPCSLLFLDLDHFKALNDGCGHLAGDSALREFAQMTRESLRAMDTAGRWGGEEFVALLPETDGEEALAIAERVRAAVATHLFTANGGMHLTCSVGVASFPQDAHDRPGLVEAADRAMYAAKHLGRNQVRAISDPALAVLDAETATSREEVALQGTVEALSALVGIRDAHTGEHTRNVARLAVEFAQKMQLDPVQIRLVELVGKLHEVGKISIPDAILQKSEPLTEEERKLIRMHPAIGAEVVGRIPSLRLAVPGIRGHHERWDGTGYPDGLAGEAIPLAARIVAVADALAAATREGSGPGGHQALKAIQRDAGVKFDPQIVAT
ncbi:MAG TPA: diguanylate cyclase, partial [Chthonomonadaceae bacterium]|nr:diguanylate cyclase [Chthonomonadaceae bacterium]